MGKGGVVCLVTGGQQAWTWNSAGTWLPLFPGTGCSIWGWSGGRMTSVCTVSCSRGCCSCVCCSFWGLVWFLLAVVGIQNEWQTTRPTKLSHTGAELSQDNSAWAELSVGRVVGGLSCLPTFRTNGDEVVKFVKHFKSSFFMALLECGPGKRVDDGVDAGCLVVSICNPSCCTWLSSFSYRHFQSRDTFSSGLSTILLEICNDLGLEKNCTQTH